MGEGVVKFLIYKSINLFLPLEQTQYYLYRTSWTKEDADKAKKCATDVSGLSQATANFDDCVDGTVTTAYGTPYDFQSIMHYDLDA